VARSFSTKPGIVPCVNIEFDGLPLSDSPLPRQKKKAVICVGQGGLQLINCTLVQGTKLRVLPGNGMVESVALTVLKKV
jgi:hypothetical protein